GLEHALRPDHDLRELEPVVRKRGEQLGVEGARPIVPGPALAGRDDLVDAIRGERRDQAVDVPAVLGDRVPGPQALGRPQLVRAEAPGEPRADRGIAGWAAHPAIVAGRGLSGCGRSARTARSPRW